jgi:hypothetical protein
MTDDALLAGISRVDDCQPPPIPADADGPQKAFEGSSRASLMAAIMSRERPSVSGIAPADMLSGHDVCHVAMFVTSPCCHVAMFVTWPCLSRRHVVTSPCFHVAMLSRRHGCAHVCHVAVFVTCPCLSRVHVCHVAVLVTCPCLSRVRVCHVAVFITSTCLSRGRVYHVDMFVTSRWPSRSRLAPRLDAPCGPGASSSRRPDRAPTGTVWSCEGRGNGPDSP